jgi:hypothetical protein
MVFTLLWAKKKRSPKRRPNLTGLGGSDSVNLLKVLQRLPGRRRFGGLFFCLGAPWLIGTRFTVLRSVFCTAEIVAITSSADDEQSLFGLGANEYGVEKIFFGRAAKREADSLPSRRTPIGRIRNRLLGWRQQGHYRVMITRYERLRSPSSADHRYVEVHCLRPVLGKEKLLAETAPMLLTVIRGSEIL